MHGGRFMWKERLLTSTDGKNTWWILSEYTVRCFKLTLVQLDLINFLHFLYSQQLCFRCTVLLWTSLHEHVCVVLEYTMWINTQTKVCANMPNVRPLKVKQFFFPPVFCHLNFIPGFVTKYRRFYVGSCQVEVSLVQNRSSVVLNEVSQQRRLILALFILAELFEGGSFRPQASKHVKTVFLQNLRLLYIYYTKLSVPLRFFPPFFLCVCMCAHTPWLVTVLIHYRHDLCGFKWVDSCPVIATESGSLHSSCWPQLEWKWPPSLSGTAAPPTAGR